jgi:23S rRNA (uracil1939-C5)-methyltransferase
VGKRRGPPPERPKIPIELEGVSHLGGAVGRIEAPDGDGRGLVHFVSYGLPGERVMAEVVAGRGSYGRARAIEVLDRPHPDRAAPPCPYFGRCGGCSWQHAVYARQLALKTETVREQLGRLGGFDDPPLRPMIGAAAPYHYRNHARFSTRRDGTLGFTREHTHWVMTIEHCHLMMPAINERLAALQGRVRGRLHQVALRHSMRTGQTLISPPIPDAPFETGQTHIEEEVLGRRFRVAANSFFQVNTRPVRQTLPAAIGAPWVRAREADWSQADLLALLALDRLGAGSGDTVVDAYSGVGTFALLIAERVGRVIALEEAASAVQDARHNAAGLGNVDFYQGRVEEVLPTLDVAPDAAVLDPARAGCARPVLDALIDRRVRRIVYVSCDPSTLARDLRILVDAGYGLVDVQPVDMFPQTYHIECVATLER